MFLLHCLYKIVITAWFWVVAVWTDVAGRHHHLHHLNAFILDRNAIKTTRPPECKTFDDDTNTCFHHHLYNLLPRQGGLSMPHTPAPTILAPPWPRAEQTSSSGFVCYFFFQRRASIFLPLSSFCCKIVLGRKTLKVAWSYMYSNYWISVLFFFFALASWCSWAQEQCSIGIKRKSFHGWVDEISDSRGDRSVASLVPLDHVNLGLRRDHCGGAVLQLDTSRE